MLDYVGILRYAAGLGKGGRDFFCSWTLTSAAGCFDGGHSAVHCPGRNHVDGSAVATTFEGSDLEGSDFGAHLRERQDIP
ncbi:hypothetical protein GCM10009638_22540 [Luteococcus sanguinis]